MADSWGRTRNYGDRMHEGMYPGHREAAREYGDGGLLGLLSGRNEDFVNSNKARMRAMGIEPSHVDREGNLTGRYSSSDWKSLQNALTGTVEIDISPITGRTDAETAHIGPLSDYGYSEDDAAAKRQLAREYGHLYQQKYSDFPQGGLGITSFMPRNRRTGKDRDLSGLSRDSRFAPGRVPGNVNDTRAYLPGRMSVGEARRARAIRNMSRRDRAAAGFGDLGPTTRWGGQDTSGRIFPEMFRAGNQYGIHSDAMDRHRANTARSGRIHDRVQMALNPERYVMMGNSQGPDSWNILVDSLEDAGFERTEDVGRRGDR